MAKQSGKTIKHLKSPPLTREGEYLLSSWDDFTEQQRQRQRKEMVTVSETFGFVAYVYEKLRSAVEYRGEHVLRRATIERTLKRILWLPTQEKAQLLIKELTWSRFLANESLPKSKVKEISQIISKYIYLLNQAENFSTAPSTKVDWQDWLIGVASTEIEETISPSYLRTTLASLMFAWLKKNFIWDTQALTEEDREIQLFIAAQRALAKSDTPILRYRLLLLMYPQWKDNQVENLHQISNILPNLGFQIEQLLNYSQRNLVFRFVRKFTPIFIILHEILAQTENPARIIRRPHLLEKVAQQLTEQKYQKLQTQVGAAIARSIIYLLITKVLLALIIELPYEMYYLKEIQYIPLLINLITPPGLMLIIGVSIRVPGQNNTERIIKQLRNLLYQSDEGQAPITAQLTLTDRQKKLNQYFSVFYIIIFIVLIYFIGMFLIKTVHYNLLSLLVFFMFASLVILFGYRVKWESEEMTIAKHSGGILTHIVSIVTMPFISLGAWLSAGIAQINIFMFILDVIIDAPLKALVGAIEEWSQFLRLKEAEVVEIPQE